MDKIHRGEFVLMDGALGTELEKRDVPIEGTAWSATAVRTSADTIREIHSDYIDAGAQIHIVNSFALARHVLQPVGLAGEFEVLNRLAVAHFNQAVAESGRDRASLFAAGSLSTFAANSDRSILPGGEVLLRNYRDQAQILFDAGVDLFALEMLFDVEVSLAMLKAVEEFGLPVIIGFTCDWDQQGGDKLVTARELGSAPLALESVLTEVIDNIHSGNAIMSIMHSEADVTDAALDVLKQHWHGPIAIYPNSGQFEDLHMQFDSVCGVEEFSAAAARWIESGVNIVGGCCGIGPQHIAAIGAKFAGTSVVY